MDEFYIFLGHRCLGKIDLDIMYLDVLYRVTRQDLRNSYLLGNYVRKIFSENILRKGKY